MIWLKIGFVTWLFIRWLYVEDTHFLVTWKLKLAMIIFLNSWELIFTVTKKECSIDWSKNRLNYFCQCAWFGKLKDGFSSWLALTMKTKRVEPFVFSLCLLRLSFRNISKAPWVLWLLHFPYLKNKPPTTWTRCSRRPWRCRRTGKWLPRNKRPSSSAKMDLELESTCHSPTW